MKNIVIVLWLFMTLLSGCSLFTAKMVNCFNVGNGNENFFEEGFAYVSKVSFDSDASKTINAQLEILASDTSYLSGFSQLKIALLNIDNRKLQFKSYFPLADAKYDGMVQNGSNSFSKYVLYLEIPIDTEFNENEYFLAVSLVSGDNVIHRFYQDNYFKGGYTILGIVGVGVKPSKYSLDDVEFDSLYDDSYTIHPDETIYPFDFRFNGNPLVRHHGAGDPDAHVWNDTVYVYCSQDNQRRLNDDGNYAVMDGYHVFSSTNLIDWTDHGEILHSRDVPWGTKGYMWAPCAESKNGKYYLYYPHMNKNNQWRVGVAVSDSPIGPFEHMPEPIEGLSDIDPMVFTDDDGQSYIYCNPGIVAKLKPNMIELAEQPRRVIYASEEIMNCDTLQYNEGPYMHKYKGKYYFSYTNWHNPNRQGYYAVADNPYGPFKWMGAMAPHPVGAQDHHSIITFKDKHYYFYHVGGLEFMPKDWNGERRILCFDEMFYNEDGSIRFIKHTKE